MEEKQVVAHPEEVQECHRDLTRREEDQQVEDHQLVEERHRDLLGREEAHRLEEANFRQDLDQVWFPVHPEK